MLDHLIEIGVDHDVAIDVEKSPMDNSPEVPSENGLGVVCVTDGKMKLLVVCSEYPRTGFVDYADKAGAFSPGAS
jgi:hypothetical protein